MAIMVKKPAVDRIAIPVRAVPLVHPLPNCEPNPKNNPPSVANINRVVELILGPLSTLKPKRPDIAPEKKEPAITPSVR